MKSKAYLLAVMAEHRACGPAVKYVTDHTSDSAEEIGLDCGQIDWLIWLLVREFVDLTEFVNGCAERAMPSLTRLTRPTTTDAKYVDVDLTPYGYATQYVVAFDKLRACAAADRRNYVAFAGFATHAAILVAAHAADSAECRLQLEQLRDLWKKWCRS